MLQDLKKLYGKKLGASDGEIGHVHDFYFDDNTWLLRYVVADTGSWLTGRQVLLTRHALDPQGLGPANPDALVLGVNLTRQQIEASPAIETHQPISRQYEEEYHQYYGWPVYWGSGALSGMAAFPPVTSPPIPDAQPHLSDQQGEDIHLRSTKAVTGYRIQATNGTLGHVISFVVDSLTWSIREIVVEAGHWFAGKKILLLPENVTRISYEDSTVFVNLTTEDIERTMIHDVAQAGVGQA